MAEMGQKPGWWPEGLEGEAAVKEEPVDLHF